MGGWVRGLAVVALLMAGFAFKADLIAPPPASEAGEFDTDRAVARLQRILGDQRPHPVDSDADDEVRGRLIAELQAIGLNPRVQDTVDCSSVPKFRVVSCSRIRNVIATLPGRTNAKHLLLNAHYDSTPTGPGAADDGLGVAVLLEIAQTLKASPPQRPVTFLFNEGEEFGLNGARAFVRSDPLANQVDSLVNIDVRGVRGPALMYETSDPNGPAIAAYAAGTRRPYANSISTDFSKLIPNSTDVTFFRPAGWTLLNYSIIGNETRYHTPGDTIAALNRDSVAHVGTEALAATRTLANMADPANAGSGRTVFSDLAGRAFFRLPLLVAAIAVALLLIVAFVLAWRKKALGRPLLIAAGTTIAGVAAAGIVSIAATFVRPGDFWRARPLVTYLAVYAVLLGAMVAVWMRWGRRLGRERMRAAAWLLILIVGAAMSIALPGATIFFLIAPTLGLTAAALRGRPATAVALVAIVVQFLMFAELLALIEMLLIDGPLWAVAPLAALAALPAIVELDADDLRPGLAALVVAALGLWIAALVLPRASTDRPAAFTIDYFRDADKKRADWAVASKQAPLPPSFPGEWRKGLLPYNMRTRWIAKAPLLDTPTPAARIVGSAPAGNGRRIRIALSTGGANAVAIRFPEGTSLLGLGKPGQLEPVPTRGEPKKASLRCSGRSCDGLVIEALLGDRKPVEVELFATRFSLPPEGKSLEAARPANAHPQYGPDSTITLVRARL